MLRPERAPNEAVRTGMDKPRASDYPWNGGRAAASVLRAGGTMATVFVAKSDSLQKWGLGVGLTKQLYALGVCAGDAKAAVAGFNEAAHAGRADWVLVKQAALPDDGDDAMLLARVGRKEMAIDPAYYPQLKGAKGIFKVKPANVENQILVEKALAGEAPKAVKMTPAAIAQYLIRAAIG